ncbi:NADPH:adrenodoxin oxidoreductase, mitochondrial [Leptinotarsa decemlineata]|uniref:NADPH:adrenodoxin oxidoreductase, mitochondrial n=1 Tax=Leptinotarsa decemlineata TaxID=7539 RepID=UPI003D305FBB
MKISSNTTNCCQRNMKIGSRLCFIKRFLSIKPHVKPKICIVGAGPAGFYSAQRLVRKLDSSEIDIYERLPVPFGLVRFGVAPDHPEVKNVINTFTKTAENPNIRFIGNVNLGRDITLEELRNAYHIILLTYGAEQGKQLSIPGENLQNHIEARKIVGWYNGIPWDANLEIDLSGEVATIFGQGNVAIDVARILLSPVDELKKTDITAHALEAISSSRIKTVYVIGRRGPLQAAFTIKELREMLKLRNCSTIWQQQDFCGIAEYIPKLERPRKRITELMLTSLGQNTPTETVKEFRPLFHRSPLQILGGNKVEGVLLGVNKLEGDNFLNQKAVLTDLQETLRSDLAISSIGYKSIQADDEIPFDFDKGVARHTNFKVDQGFYVSGWLGTGPQGVILTTMNNAFSVADKILEDMQSENLVKVSKAGYDAIEKILSKKNIQRVMWKDWNKIDKYELRAGAKVGKPREKIIEIEKMLEIAAS